MGRKKRPVATRSKAVNQPPPPSLSNDGDDADVSLLTEEQNWSINSSIGLQMHQINLENEASRLIVESEGYSGAKIECEKALNAIRRGNHTKALRLMKEMCVKYENDAACLSLICRVQGTVCVKVATIIDDPNVKQRHLRNAIESAKKAVMLSPNSIEFAHFYANLLSETAVDGKDYEDSVRECERALMIKNPIDPGKESLLDESQQKIATPDARIEHVQNELRALLQRASIGTLSTWMRNLGNGDEKFRFIPVRRVPDDPMDVKVVQARRPNDIKKASKTDEERKKEIEVKVAAARLLQQKLESSQSQTETDKGPESSSGPGQRTGDRRKSGKVKRSATISERKDNVLRFWKSMSTDLKKDLYKITVLDIESHFKSQKDGLAYEVITEALSFGMDNGWRFWMCCRCGEKFADLDLHKQHVLQEHMESLSPKFQAVLPPDVDSEWTEMLLTYPWKALDVNAAVQMVDLANGGLGDSYRYEDSWASMECDQNEGCNSWPLSNDIERTELLEKIKTLFHLLIKHNCLAASHLTKVIQFAVEELRPQLLNSGVEQSPICICFLGAAELTKVLMFLQELSRSCGIGRYSENSNAIEELSNVTQGNEASEKIAFDKDGLSLLLNDDESLLSWIFSGPTSQEQLTLWTKTRDEKIHKGLELLDTIGKEFSHLQSLCDRKLEHLSYEQALQLVEDLCLEEGKKRENVTEQKFGRQSYESVLRKRREEITQHDTDVTIINRFEVEALTNVLKEVDSFNLNQFRFEDTYGVDLESGENDWRVNEYLQQLDTCIEIGIQKQKEQLSVELSKIDARIMRNLCGMQQLEAKLGPLCGHDYRLIVVPLVKSYLRARLENLAEKDATEKSDAAREAFLAELALDSRKGSGDVPNPKHLNDKVKDKRKNKEYRKTKDYKAGDTHCLPNVNAEMSSLDEQANESVDEVGVFHQEDDDEVRRRKTELEAEERKLEETLKYQRRIEDEAKQRHLARMTPMSVEPVKQSNGLLSPTEDGLSERTGRRSRRQKNTTKVIDGRQQTMPGGKETNESGQSTYADFLQGDKETKVLILQAEDDDGKRFQADLSKAVRQSLDAFHSEDSCITSIEVESDNVNGIGSDVYGTGLKNEAGEYNCFLNVIIQSLWHLRGFREEFLGTSTCDHLHVGDPCVTCALYDIFSALNSASTDTTKVEAVAPTSLRIALSNLYPHSNFFQEAQMNDASEVLGVIFDCLHKSFTSGVSISNIDQTENNKTGSWECINKEACTAHSLFGMDIFERMNCYNCGLETRSLKYTSFFHQINANALRTMKVMCPKGSFDELLNLVEMNHQLACDPEDGGCGKLNYIHHILSNPPHVFTTVLGWQNTCESVEDIKATLAALSTEIDLSVLYHGLDPNNTRRLVSVVCYYGQHYHCFAYSHVHHRWVMYDDKTVKVVGKWEDVVSMCEKGHLQPQVLFYEAVN